ncbi:MAG: hypothetical protein HC825_07845 [Oscillatoriales cyanobacterium RM1_1_9]|nr:hypothetical protein [Oscillatoriales cyanobacterium RM1_1_9]
MIPINTYSSVDPTRTSNVLNQIPPGTIQQARQGKAGAILQVLNRLLAELKLADLEVKARAVLREGVLYVLCEAPTARSLDQSTIVSTVCRGLTILQPDHVATARIYGRVEQAEQLLWLDQLDSDLHPPLLWQEEIPLQQPNLFQRFLAGLMAHSRGKVTSASRDQTMIFDSIQVPPSRNRFRYGFSWEQS